MARSADKNGGHGNGNGANGTAMKLLWWLAGLASLMIMGFIARMESNLAHLSGIVSERGERITRIEETAKTLTTENRRWLEELSRRVERLEGSRHSGKGSEGL